MRPPSTYLLERNSSIAATPRTEAAAAGPSHPLWLRTVRSCPTAPRLAAANRDSCSAPGLCAGVPRFSLAAALSTGRGAETSPAADVLVAAAAAAAAAACAAEAAITAGGAVPVALANPSFFPPAASESPQGRPGTNSCASLLICAEEEVESKPFHAKPGTNSGAVCLNLESSPPTPVCALSLIGVCFGTNSRTAEGSDMSWLKLVPAAAARDDRFLPASLPSESVAARTSANARPSSSSSAAGSAFSSSSSWAPGEASDEGVTPLRSVTRFRLAADWLAFTVRYASSS
mmetsp:Transcript_35935/g.84130  ORF Transcript_35935/g.84130 Transcript_35935/m.84130 type:complete len:289 (-) Transcript_35935:428-1294(-)